MPANNQGRILRILTTHIVAIMEVQEVIDGLNNPLRIASTIGQLPDYQRADIAKLVADKQVPGSFGDLIKRSFGVIEEGRRLEGGNVISMVGRHRKE
jgi:hypothetical protein